LSRIAGSDDGTAEWLAQDSRVKAFIEHLATAGSGARQILLVTFK